MMETVRQSCSSFNRKRSKGRYSDARKKSPPRYASIINVSAMKLKNTINLVTINSRRINQGKKPHQPVKVATLIWKKQSNHFRQHYEITFLTKEVGTQISIISSTSSLRNKTISYRLQVANITIIEKSTH